MKNSHNLTVTTNHEDGSLVTPLRIQSFTDATPGTPESVPLAWKLLESGFWKKPFCRKISPLHHFDRKYRFLSLAAMSLVLLVSAGCPHVNSGLPPSVRLPPLEPTLPAAGVYHPVSSGETLGSIAGAYEVEPQHLAEVNNLRPPYNLGQGGRVFIPGAPEVKRVEATTKRVPVESKVEEFSGILSWPVEGQVVSGFGVREGMQHNGIGIEAAEGTPVRCAAEGKVGYVGQIAGYGNVILIEHANRMVTVYAHLKDIRTKRGDQVNRGDVVGTVGTSGRVDTASLYFEVRSKSKPRNPLFFLPRRA